MGEGKERGPPIIFTNYNLVARFVWLTNFISFSLFFHFQTIIRKREVVISRVSGHPGHPGHTGHPDLLPQHQDHPQCVGDFTNFD